MKRITTRFVLLIVSAAVAPLLLYGLASVNSLRTGVRASVREGNLNVTHRAAEQIELYVTNNLKLLGSLGAELQETRLEHWQQDRILKNHVLEFPELREITLFDEQGRAIVTSRIGEPGVTLPEPATALSAGQSYISPVMEDDDLLPTTTVALRLKDHGPASGWLVGELSLEELWRMVDSIRIGEQGFAMLFSADSQLIAHGDPDEKRRIASSNPVADRALTALLGEGPDRFGVYTDARGRQMLAAAAYVEPLGWTLIVEQPTAEAYGLTLRLERQLLYAIALALFATVTIGSLWSRSFIRRIFALRHGTQAIAEGRLDARVRVEGRDEIGQLSEAFNTMADRLVALQENVRRQERQAMFGRVAAGLVHDISHPIQNIGNSCKLIVRMFDDLEYRETFQRTVDREFSAIKQVLDDLRNIARPATVQRYPMDLNRSVTEAVESMRAQADSAGLTLQAQLSPEPIFIEGDLFALGRVHRNLIVNAIQATTRGGLVAVTTETVDGHAQVRVYDTGCGIPAGRLDNIFDDFVTTKHRGLGLGLAICKRIVEQLGGTIAVTSEVGKGTTFVLEFPTTEARPMPAAAAG